MSRRITVLAAGRGTNLQALLTATRAGHLDAQVVAVVSHVAGAPALERARDHGIPTYEVAPPGPDRVAWDEALADLVARTAPDLIYLLGWMRILGPGFLARFPHPARPHARVLNLHPALPGELPGQHAIARAFAQFKRGERTHTGAMVHVVTPEVDVGPVLAAETLAIPSTRAALEAALHAVEHRLVVLAARRFFGDEP